MIEKPSLEALVEHLKTGCEGCLVCGSGRISGTWTDFNGEIKCSTCGMCYQIISSKFSNEWLEEHNLKKEEIKVPHCPDFEFVPVNKAYFEQTGRKIPVGSYFGERPFTNEDVCHFCAWVLDNKEELSAECRALYNWDSIVKNANKVLEQ